LMLLKTKEFHAHFADFPHAGILRFCLCKIYRWL
jgi:hypothetical protein